MFREGEGVKQDHEKALALLKEGARNGDAQSHFEVGVMCENSFEALKWFQDSSNNGFANASFRLGI